MSTRPEPQLQLFSINSGQCVSKAAKKKGVGDTWKSRGQEPLPPLIKPCIRFSRTRLSDVLHVKACALFQGAVAGSLNKP